MDSNANVTIIVYFKRFVIWTAKEDVTFICDEPIYFMIPQTMSFLGLNIGLCQGVNIDTQKKVVRIKYKCSISIVSGSIIYWTAKVSNDNNMWVMFIIYSQYQLYIIAIELYIEFKEVVIVEADYEASPYSYPVRQHHDKVILSSYLVRLVIFY